MGKKALLMRTSLTTPALQWIEGHILGNGDLGAVVWGTPHSLRFGLSKHNVNDLLRNQMREGWEFNYQEMADQAVAGFRGFTASTMPQRESSLPGPCQLPCGQLSIDLFRGLSWGEFAQELDMESATCRVKARATVSSVNWGGRPDFEVSSFVHAERNLLVVRLRSDFAQSAALRFSGSAAGEGIPAAELGYRGETPFMSQPLPMGQGYAMAIRVWRGAATFEPAAGAFHANLPFGGQHGDAVLVLSIECEDDHARVGGRTTDLPAAAGAALDKLDAEELAATHTAWWSEFWGKSAVSHYDEDIARWWYFGVYALASATRPGKSPPHLQGVWNQFDTPPWHADFHFNTNVQMSQWIACRSNHPELQEALVEKMTGEWRRHFQDYARDVFGTDGVAMPLCADWFGRAIGWGGLGLEMSITAWMAGHLVEQWEFTRDETLLAAKVFPFLEEACAFYGKILRRRPDGSYNVELSHSPEQIWRDEREERYLVFGTNPTIDLVFIRALFKAALEAAEQLGRQDAPTRQWREILDDLPDNPVADGVLIDQETGFFHDGDRPGRFPVCHRHPSRLVGIYPGDEIGLASPPETLELGVSSFAEFRSYGRSGFTGWSMAWQAAIAARLGLADDAEAILRELKRHFTLPGMLNSHNSLSEKGNGDADILRSGEPLFQLEANIGAAAAVNEMLAHSHHSTLFLFPGVPPGKSAAFKNLRMKGHILVSAELVNGLVTWVEITSQVIETNIGVRSPWRGGFTIESACGTIEVQAPAVDIALNLLPGETLALRPIT